MSPAIRPNEIVVLRKPSNIYPSDRWKVTSRYLLLVSSTKTMHCVRVSLLSHGVVLHLSKKEFHRLFRTETITHNSEYPSMELTLDRAFCKRF